MKLTPKSLVCGIGTAILFCHACNLGELDLNNISLVETSDPKLFGVWLSTGSNIAPFVQNNADTVIDSLYLTFNRDYTYIEKQVNKNGLSVKRSGTYSVSSSFFGNIWGIALKQTSPAAVTLAGIYEIEGNTVMKYEVVQTGRHTAPTPVGGFGSTDSGRLGNTNIQKYTRIR